MMSKRKSEEHFRVGRTLGKRIAFSRESLKPMNNLLFYGKNYPAKMHFINDRWALTLQADKQMRRGDTLPPR